MPQIEPKVELLAHTPDALSLIYAAFRQCYHAGFVGDMWEKLLAGQITRQTQAEFVAKVIDSGHVSPVEHVTFTFAIAGVSRALTHQLVRHRVASYSQQSQRYVDGSDFNYILPPAIAKNAAAKQIFEKCMTDLRLAYQGLKQILEESGRADKAAEDARFVLPQAAETRIVVTMNCRALLNFFEQRCCNRAQWEIRQVATACLKLCQEILPAIFASAGARCEKLGYCPEGEKFTCGRYPLPPKLI
jgi:thymidylate synthase (FAD)